MVGGCIIPRRESHLLQLYAFLQKLILILVEPLLILVMLNEFIVMLNEEERIDWLYKFHYDIIVQEKNVCIASRPRESIPRPAGHPKLSKWPVRFFTVHWLVNSCSRADTIF